jgi:GTP-binding protein
MGDHEADGREAVVTEEPGRAPDPDRFDDPASLEAGRMLFAQRSTFLQGVARLDQLPPVGLPEVAMAGRSNVGKSSLINALTGRTSLARTSNTPGRTQEINLFDLAGRMMLVDLPGYGYAQAPKDVVERWTRLVFAYLRGRPSLMRVCLLIDARHGPKKADEEVLELLGKAAVPFQLVLTKIDLVRRVDLEALTLELQARLEKLIGALPQLLATSARERAGVDLLRASLAKLARPPQESAAS